MPFEPEIEELVTRSVAIVACHYRFAVTWKDWASTVLKIQKLSEQLESSEVSLDSIRPLMVAKLSERFDRETADRLSLDFTDLVGWIAASSPATVGHG